MRWCEPSVAPVKRIRRAPRMAICSMGNVGNASSVQRMSGKASQVLENQVLVVAQARIELATPAFSGRAARSTGDLT